MTVLTANLHQAACVRYFLRLSDSRAACWAGRSSSRRSQAGVEYVMGVCNRGWGARVSVWQWAANGSWRAGRPCRFRYSPLVAACFVLAPTCTQRSSGGGASTDARRRMQLALKGWAAVVQVECPDGPSPGEKGDGCMRPQQWPSATSFICCCLAGRAQPPCGACSPCVDALQQRLRAVSASGPPTWPSCEMQAARPRAGSLGR